MKKAQFFYGMIDASTLPRWILYPMMILVMLVLLMSVLFLGTFTYCMFKDNCSMPFGYYMPLGMGHYFPVWVSSYQYKSQSQECYVNSQKINCSEIQE